MDSAKAQLRMENHQTYLDSLAPSAREDKPNIVLIMVDDMGHGDLSCYGSKAIYTPHLDALAQDGLQMTHFYASSPICSPSRFGCLTGRYPTRGFVHGVYFPTVDERGRQLNADTSPYGIQGILPDELTFAEALQRSGYRTGIFGKWHLGDLSPHLPNEKGFDTFFGSYYSNDMRPYAYFRNNEEVIPAPADQTTLTRRITDEILSFIDENQHQPFLVYYPSPFPHDPVHASAEFTGVSKGGAFGDCVQEIDWSVGQIRAKLAECGLTGKTLVIFTSDNGPWYEGSPGLHRGRKGNTFDGGQVVPMLAAFPGVIPPGSHSDEPAMNIDFLPTFLNLAGIPLPEDRIIDGKDILPLLQGLTSESPHQELLFIWADQVLALRDREGFKYHAAYPSENTTYRRSIQGPFLFDLNHDPDESYNNATHFPQKTSALAARLEEIRRSMAENPRGWIE